jgi:peptide chain release factor 3
VHEQSTFLDGVTTPVLFGSAVLNFGVRQLLDTLLSLAPAPAPRPDVQGRPRPLDKPFSAFVFKIQAGMDAAHRDRLAYVRVCSGVFERGTVVTHSATGKPFATKYAQQVFGRERETVDLAYPGDVVGLVNAAALRVGDSLYVEEPVTFPPIPSFAPEHFAVARPWTPALQAVPPRHRAARAGGDRPGAAVRPARRPGPVLAAVGPMQFEVAEHRMAGEFSSPVRLGPARLHDGPPHRPHLGQGAGRGERRRGARAQQRRGACSRCSPATGGCSGCCATTPTPVLEPLVAAGDASGPASSS